MKKRIFAMVLAVMLTLSLLPVSVLATDATSGTCGENVTWSFDEASGTLTISGEGEMENYDSSVAAPWYAFRTDIVEVVLEEGVTSVGNYAFGTEESDGLGYPLSHYYLDRVWLSNSLSRIGCYAFYGAVIDEIEIHDGITYEAGAFREIGLLRLADGMTTVPLGIRGVPDAMDIPVSVTDIPVYSCTYPRYVHAFYRGTEEQWLNIRLWYAPNSFDFYEDYSEVEYYIYEPVLNGFRINDIDLECWGFSVADCGKDYYLDHDGVLHLFADDETAKEKYGDIVTEIVIEEAGLPGWTWTGQYGFTPDVFLSTNFVEGYTNLETITLYSGCHFACEGLEKWVNLHTVYYGGSKEQWDERHRKTIEETFAEQIVVYNHPSHEWDSGVITSEASCEIAGEKTFTCEICEKTKTEAISAKGHSFRLGLCTVCDEIDPNFVKPPFTDVADTDWFYNPVMWAYSNNVTGGTSATTFGPDAGCTRAQVVTFLWAANGKPEPKSMDNPFDDVASDAWYLKPVLWAVAQGITGGVAEGKFGPEQTCTRAQIATFLYAAAGKPEVKGKSTFSDVADDAWYAKPVIWAAENEVTGGIGDGKFGPENTCTRAQVVTFLYKVYG